MTATQIAWVSEFYDCPKHGAVKHRGYVGTCRICAGDSVVTVRIGGGDPTRQRHIDKIRAILGHPHNSTCKTSAFDRDDGSCDCGAEDKARRIVEYFERVESGT